MSTIQELTPEQIVAVAIAHEFVTSAVDVSGALPSLSETLAHVRSSYDADVENLIQAIGAGLKSEKMIKGAVGLMAMLADRRSAHKPTP